MPLPDGDTLLGKTAHLGGISVIPYGIPWPEIYRVDFDFGHRGTMAGSAIGH